jgi:hypothetical protein
MNISSIYFACDQEKRYWPNTTRVNHNEQMIILNGACQVGSSDVLNKRSNGSLGLLSV